jgi:hypothetical protein
LPGDPGDFSALVIGEVAVQAGEPGGERGDLILGDGEVGGFLEEPL